MEEAADLEPAIRRGVEILDAQGRGGIDPAMSAEDHVQDAVVRMLSRRPAGVESREAWLLTSARNLAIDAGRRRARFESRLALLAAGQPSTTDAGETSGDGSWMLAQLPPRTREVFRLHYVHDLPVSVVAQTLGITSGTVKSTLARGRETLREAVPLPGTSNKESATMAKQINGWYTAGDSPRDYAFTLNDEGGETVLHLEPVVEAPESFASFMQTVSARNYRGRKVRLTADARTTKAIGAGYMSLWMRVDEPGGGISAFDNMFDRAPRGVYDWTPGTVVLDVNDTAEAIAFGVLIAGVCIGDFRRFAFGEVDDAEPTTDNNWPSAPVNLDFADR